MFTLNRTGTDLVAAFGKLPEQARQAVAGELRDQTDLLESTVIGKLSGEVLNSVSGRLRGQVRNSVDTGGEVMTGRVFMAGDLTVALVHEFGGQAWYEILPVQAHALHFFAGGAEVFAAHVNHPPLPERSYLRSSLRERLEPIAAGFKTALARVFGRSAGPS